MLLNRLWKHYNFNRAEAKAANILVVVFLFFGTLGVLSFVFPAYAGMIWLTLGHIVLGAIILGAVGIFIYAAWCILAAMLE